MYQHKQSVFFYLTLLIILLMSFSCENSGSDSQTVLPLTFDFNHDTVYVEIAGGTKPSSLLINASKPVSEDTIFSITCTDDASLSVPLQVTMLTGNSSVNVPLTGNIATLSSITVSALFESHNPTVIAKVYDDTLNRSVISIEPDPLSTTTGSVESLEVFLDLPAETGGTTVSLATTGGVGTVPANVTVSTGDFSANFDLTASGSAASGTVSATLLASNVSVTVDVSDP